MLSVQSIVLCGQCPTLACAAPRLGVRLVCCVFLCGVCVLCVCVLCVCVCVCVPPVLKESLSQSNNQTAPYLSFVFLDHGGRWRNQGGS
jgi:hypothetical protein